ASATTPATVSVSVNGTGLSVGQYTGQVTITSSGANGSPIAVPVVLNVISPATVTASPSTLSFNYTIGTQTPSPQSFTVNSSVAISVTAAVQFQGGTSGWLSVTPAQGAAPGTFTATVTPGSLAAGIYSATISLTSPNLVNPVTVSVSITVTAIPK